MPGDFGNHDPNDPSGRYFYQGSVNPNDPSVANGQISPAQWAEYKAKRKRDAILGVLGIIGGTSAASGLASMIGGGASGVAGAAAPSALPPVAGGAPWAITPYAGTAMSVPTGAAAVGGTVGAGAGIAGTVGAGSGAGGAAGGAGAAEAARTFLGLSPRDWAAITGTGLATIPALTADNPNTNLDTSTQDPQMKELMDLMMGRLRKSEPLHDSILSMANGLLPTRYQNGGRG